MIPLEIPDVLESIKKGDLWVWAGSPHNVGESLHCNGDRVHLDTEMLVAMMELPHGYVRREALPSDKGLKCWQLHLTPKGTNYVAWDSTG